MTYGVPYSFVPGTKARADEVNANFIDVLDKIDETNTKIDDANAKNSEDLGNLETSINDKITTVQTSVTKCANTSLSNLDSTGKAVLSAKADSSLLDGTWVNKAASLASNVYFNGNDIKTYSLSSYLPTGSNIYEVLVCATGSGNCSMWITTDLITTKSVICKNNGYSGGCTIIPVGKSKQIKVQITNNAANMDFLAVRAYRKVR
ncbi:MAG: hypothetical protein NC191_08500 [Muribaculaceae bacterium]|nr:hypothetical protein [Muribaculaceae bacterium]